MIVKEVVIILILFLAELLAQYLQFSTDCKNLWECFLINLYKTQLSLFSLYTSWDGILFTTTNLSNKHYSNTLHDLSPSWPITYKLSTSLAFLIVIRGCLPRYRYDFLTKLGWIKFLGQTLMVFTMTTITNAIV